jgi:hypothetical protein
MFALYQLAIHPGRLAVIPVFPLSVDTFLNDVVATLQLIIDARFDVLYTARHTIDDNAGSAQDRTVIPGLPFSFDALLQISSRTVPGVVFTGFYDIYTIRYSRYCSAIFLGDGTIVPVNVFAIDAFLDQGGTRASRILFLAAAR